MSGKSEAEEELGADNNTAALVLMMPKVPTVNDETEGFDVLSELARKVARAFYPGVTIVIVDLLLARAPISETALMEALKFHPKQLKLAIEPLIRMRLVSMKKVYEPPPPPEPGMELEMKHVKGIKKEYYSVNFKGLVDTVTYKIVEMDRLIGEKIKAARKYAFQCSVCERKFTDVDAQTSAFKCARDGSSLVSIDVNAKYAELEEDERQLHTQLADIQALLHRAQQFVWHEDAEGDSAILTKEELEWKLQEEAEHFEREAQLRRVGMRDQRIIVDIEEADKADSRRTGLSDLPHWMLAPAVPPPDPASASVMASRFADDPLEIARRRAARTISAHASRRTSASSSSAPRPTRTVYARLANSASALSRSQSVMRHLSTHTPTQTAAPSPLATPPHLHPQHPLPPSAAASHKSYVDSLRAPPPPDPPLPSGTGTGNDFLEVLPSGDVVAMDLAEPPSDVGPMDVASVQHDASRDSDYDDDDDDNDYHNINDVAPIIVKVGGLDAVLQDLTPADVGRMTADERAAYDALIASLCNTADFTVYA